MIHYCWFGGNEKPELIRKCMESWKTFCPDYEIVEWNEDNFDINCCQYVADAYAAKKWAFVSDYARLWVVYHHGGIYLDTDVELRSSLDDLLQYDAWFAQEDIRTISTGLGFGATCANGIVKAVMDAYLKYEFPNGVNTLRDTPIFERELTGWKKSNYSSVVDNTLIIGSYDVGKYLKHLYMGSWGESENVKRRMIELEQQKRNRWSIFMWKIKTALRSPKMIAFLDKHRGENIEKILTFCLYDLLDYGPWHFIKRLFHKLIGGKNEK